MATAGRVVHVNRDKFDVYIGRACHGLKESKWANRSNLTRAEALQIVVSGQSYIEALVRKYEQDIRKHPELLAALPELEHQVLGCWCAPSGGWTLDDPKPPRCHGQVLLKLLAERNGE